MDENPEFERTRDFLKTKLADYLRQKGIDIRKPFRCLNPEHEDQHPSMSFNAQKNNVHCFGCDVSYDIFDLIGLEHNLDSFKEQYDLACRMYLAAPLKPQRPFFSSPSSASAEGAPAPKTIAAASFGTPRFTLQQREDPAQNSEGTARSEQSSRHAAFVPINDEAQSQRPIGQGAAFFGTASKGAYFESYHTKITSSPLMPRKKSEEQMNYHDYLDLCAKNAFKTDYFHKRGLSDEVIKRFKLGYDPEHPAGGETWQVAVIPYNDYAYMVRNINSTGNDDRIKKRGKAQIFNLEALNRPQRIFVTEGEFDALSLETLGFPAISLGGASNVYKLITYLKEHPLEGRSICLMPDNDEAGRNATTSLSRELAILKIPYEVVNLTSPYKDANEALCKDRETLHYRLEHLDDILALKLEGPEKSAGEDSFISDANSLLSLAIGECLHSLCGRAPALRRTLSFILDTGVANVLFVGSRDDWKTACSLVNRPLDNEDNSFAKCLYLERPADEKLCGQLETALASLSMSTQESFIPVISLLSSERHKAQELIERLNTLSLHLKTPIMLLCPPSLEELCEALCRQSLTVKSDERGDLIYEGLSRSAVPLSFKLSIRDF